MPKRRQSLLLGHALPILLASSLVLSTHFLWAQKSLPPEARADLGAVPGILPEAPRSQIESGVKLFRISYHHTLVNTQAALNIQQPTGTAELLGKEKYFTDRTSSQGLTSAYGKVHYPTIQPADHLLRYGHHIPWAGPTILLVSQQAKAHPQVTRVLKLFQPQF